MKHTEETKLKLSLMRLGEKNPFYGKHHTAETKAKLARSTRRFNSKTRKYEIEPRTIFPISMSESAYIAGIVDGDGSIGFVRGRPRIAIYNNDLSLMHWLDVRLGGRSKIADKRGRTPNYSYEIYSARNVYALCKWIARFLVIKWSAAQEVMKFLELKYGKGNLD